MKNSKNKKNMLALMIFAIVFAILFTGCSSGFSMGGTKDSKDENFNGNYIGYDSDGIAGGGSSSPKDNENKYNSIDLEESGSNLPSDRKIIRDANITMEVEEVKEAFENILTLLNSFGGYESQRDMRDYMITATFKVPANKLDDFIGDLKGEGNIISSVITSTDISENYFDAEIRLETLKKTLEKYYEFLANAENITAQLSITQEISNLTAEIEQLEGKLKRWNSLVEYSTVIVEIYKIYEAPKPERVINWNSLSLDDMGWYISSGFLTICNGIFSVFQWIIVVIATASPILIPIIVFIIILVWRVKKNKKNNINANTNNDNNNNNRPVL